MEKTVLDLIEESCLAYEKNDSKSVRENVDLIFDWFSFSGIGKSGRSNEK